VLARLRSRLTYANVMATIAVFVALGGTSIAAISLTKGSVKRKHIARNAITSPKVKNGALRAIDFARDQLPAGPQGPPGPAGPSNPNADTLDGFDSSAFSTVGHTHAGPRFIYANTASTTDLDPDPQPVVCQTDPYTPANAERAWIDVWLSMNPNTSLFYAVYPVYSTDGGTTWKIAAPGDTAFASRAGSTGTGEWSTGVGTSSIPLTPGTAYRFGVRTERADAGTGDATAHRCTVRVQVTPGS
jgi:hypothetical protein